MPDVQRRTDFPHLIRKGESEAVKFIRIGGSLRSRGGGRRSARTFGRHGRERIMRFFIRGHNDRFFAQRTRTLALAPNQRIKIDLVLVEEREKFRNTVGTVPSPSVDAVAPLLRFEIRRASRRIGRVSRRGGAVRLRRAILYGGGRERAGKLRDLSYRLPIETIQRKLRLFLNLTRRYHR